MRNDLYCVEWDGKLYYTIQYTTDGFVKQTGYDINRAITHITTTYV